MHDCEFAGRWHISDFVQRCQKFAGQEVADRSVSVIGAGLRDLAFSVQPDCSMSERLAVRHLFGLTAARIARSTKIDSRLDFVEALIDWTVSDISSPAWHRNMERFAASCAAAIGDISIPNTGVRPSRRRVERILRTIEERYTDRHLSLGEIAKLSNASISHVSRLVKQETGMTVATHIHNARIRTAKVQLRRTSPSVKEIAFLVGYKSSTQFGRHFRKLVGTTPNRFRHRCYIPAN